MKLPALRNTVPASLIDGMPIEEFIRNSTQNLQRMSAAMPGGGGGMAFLKFSGKTGEWQLGRETIDPESLGRILTPHNGLFESCIEWANGSPLQKVPPRQMLGVHYDEPMSERLLPKPLSPNAYKKTYDGPTLTVGFVGFMLDDGATVMFEASSMGGTKAISALATTIIQAVAAFGEIVHPVIELGVESYEAAHGTMYNPTFRTIGYVTHKRTQEVDVIADSDIVTRPTPTRAKQRRATTEAPAI